MSSPVAASDSLFPLNAHGGPQPPLAKNKQARLLQLSSMHCRLLQHELDEVKWFKLNRRDYELGGDIDYVETAINEQRNKIERIEVDSDELRSARDGLDAMLDELLKQLEALK